MSNGHCPSPCCHIFIQPLFILYILILATMSIAIIVFIVMSMSPLVIVFTLWRWRARSCANAGVSPTSIVLENETTLAAGEPLCPHLDHRDLDKPCSFNESREVTWTSGLSANIAPLPSRPPKKLILLPPKIFGWYDATIWHELMNAQWYIFQKPKLKWSFLSLNSGRQRSTNLLDRWLSRN